MARSRRTYQRSTSHRAAGLLALALPAPIAAIVNTSIGPTIILIGVPILIVMGLLRVNWQDGAPHLTINPDKAAELRYAARDHFGNLQANGTLQQWEQTASHIWNSVHPQNTSPYSNSPYDQPAGFPSTEPPSPYPNSSPYASAPPYANNSQYGSPASYGSSTRYGTPAPYGSTHQYPTTGFGTSSSTPSNYGVPAHSPTGSYGSMTASPTQPGYSQYPQASAGFQQSAYAQPAHTQPAYSQQQTYQQPMQFQQWQQGSQAPQAYRNPPPQSYHQTAPYQYSNTPSQGPYQPAPTPSAYNYQGASNSVSRGRY
jgi:hypothetical protein